MVSCRLRISQSEGRILSDTDRSEIMYNLSSTCYSVLVCSWVFSRCFVSNAKKITQQLLFKNMVPWQLLSRHVKYLEQPTIQMEKPTSDTWKTPSWKYPDEF